MNSKIFVVTHKKIEISLPQNYIPIQVCNEELGYIKDSSCENISAKNKNYCELSSIFWVWKNYNIDFDFIGFSHYRRYLSKNKYFKKSIIKEKDIERYMKNYDIILPKKFNFTKNVWNNYFLGGAGKEKDLKELKKIIFELKNDYVDDFDNITNSYCGYYCNIFIMRKEEFYDYCQWLFDILFELEKRIDLTTYSVAEARIYGYLSEILLNVWVRHKKLKIKELDMLKIDESITAKIRKDIKNHVNIIKRRVKK